MKNSTKIRLHLSKQLFESLTKQVIAESKKGDMSGGAYTEAVKTPKGEKKEKAPKEEGKADKGTKAETHSDKKVRPEVLNVSKNATPNQVHNIGDLKRKLVDLSRQVTLMKGLDSAEIGLIIKLLDDVMKKVPAKSIAAPLKTATKAFDASTGGMKNEMETKVAEDADPNVANPMHYVSDPGLQAVTQYIGYLLLGGGASAIVKGIYDDVKKGKLSKKQAALKVADALEKAATKVKD